MEYLLISAEEPFKLNSMVNDKLAEGWELYGFPTASIGVSPTSAKIQHKLYTQALIKQLPGAISNADLSSSVEEEMKQEQEILEQWNKAKAEIVPDKETEEKVLEQWNKTKEEIVKQDNKEIKGFMAKAEELLKADNNKGEN